MNQIMALLMNMTKQCGKPFTPGTNATLYYSCSCEHNVFPGVLTTTNQGDSVTLDGPFDFSTAPSGEGFWKQVDILVDTGAIKEAAEGEVGGQGMTSSVPFFVPGTGPAQTEFAKCTLAISGCWIGMIKAKDADLSSVIGTVNNPAVVLSLEGGTGEKNGDRRGIAYEMKASTNVHYYDDATHGIDVTPNP